MCNRFYANLSYAILVSAGLGYANLCGAILRNADLSKAHLTDAHIRGADLRNSILRGADLSYAELSYANLENTDLSYASLNGAQLVKTKLSNANLTGCSVFGVSAWSVELNDAEHNNLIITDYGEPTITVDNIEVVQFIYRLINNDKIRDVINTIGQKAVLILGRFSSGRKEVLDAIADRLRHKGFIPIIFDFEKSRERDFTETIKILAGLSLFVIADITNPRSNPLELQATVPDYMIPFVPILQEGETPYSMFIDLQRKFTWVLPVIEYDTLANLLAGLEDGVISPALSKHEELIERKAEELRITHIRDVLSRNSSEA